jgi:hypothetical protein
LLEHAAILYDAPSVCIGDTGTTAAIEPFAVNVFG